MGNKTISLRIKGITHYYANDHIDNYQIGEFLYLEPEPNNFYDKNAIVVYDRNDNKLGYVPKESNIELLPIIAHNRYFCIINSLYKQDYSSIGFSITYECNGRHYSVDKTEFEQTYISYKRHNTHKNDIDLDSIAIEFLSLLNRIGNESQDFNNHYLNEIDNNYDVNEYDDFEHSISSIDYNDYVDNDDDDKCDYSGRQMFPSGPEGDAMYEDWWDDWMDD